ncbi:hypothetical protein ACWGKQ_01670 [Streptomyces sp. NPDC054770]
MIATRQDAAVRFALAQALADAFSHTEVLEAGPPASSSGSAGTRPEGSRLIAPKRRRLPLLSAIRRPS